MVIPSYYNVVIVLLLLIKLAFHLQYYSILIKLQLLDILTYKLWVTKILLLKYINHKNINDAKQIEMKNKLSIPTNIILIKFQSCIVWGYKKRYLRIKYLATRIFVNRRYRLP